MPGIAGIIAKRPSFVMGQLVPVMVQRMKHEVFHSHATYVDAERKVGVGWVYDADGGCDSMIEWNHAGDVGVVCLGESWIAGSECTSQKSEKGLGCGGVVGAILASYEKEGLEFLGRINGRFCGLLIDRREHKAVLFNDRYGLGRIYYHDSPDAFYFSSEAKSLLAVLPRLRGIDQRSLAEFYSVGCVLQNRSLFSDVSLLPAGARWCFHREGRVERVKYFHSEVWEQQPLLDARTYCERLQEVFSRVVPRYLRGTASMAMSLTGGLDSRMLLAWAQAVPGSLPCYTFGSPYRDSADVRIARRLAAVTRQCHTTIPVGKEFFSSFPELAQRSVYLSDGEMDVTGAVELYVNRFARQIAAVRLTGNYGSEILRSNVAFRPRRLKRSLFTPEFCELLDEAVETYRTEAAGHRLSFIAFKQVPWHHYARFSIEQSQLTPRTPYLDNELVALAYQAPSELVGSVSPLLQLIGMGNPALVNLGTDRALGQASLLGVGKLAQAWQEFTVKTEYAYDYGMPGWLTQIDRFCSAMHLERLFLGRHKFYHFRIWYKEQLRSYLETWGSDSSGEPSCYRAGVRRQIIQSHLDGRDNNTLELHKLLSVQLIERVLLSR